MCVPHFSLSRINNQEVGVIIGYGFAERFGAKFDRSTRGFLVVSYDVMITCFPLLLMLVHIDTIEKIIVRLMLPLY
jgi:hypothetical protein